MDEFICPHCNGTLDSRWGTDWHALHVEECAIEQILGKELFDAMEHLDPSMEEVSFETDPNRSFYVHALSPVLAFHRKEIMRWYELYDEGMARARKLNPFLR